jgi:hypothetical protein
VESVEGGSFEKLENEAYLITVTDTNAYVTLKPSKTLTYE